MLTSRVHTTAAAPLNSEDWGYLDKKLFWVKYYILEYAFHPATLLNNY